MYWTMKTGEKILIQDMADSHVLNTKRFLAHKEQKLNEEIDAGWGCLSYLQGEMAEYYCGQDIDYLYKKLHGIQLWQRVFDEEIKRRNIVS